MKNYDRIEFCYFMIKEKEKHGYERKTSGTG